MRMIQYDFNHFLILEGKVALQDSLSELGAVAFESSQGLRVDAYQLILLK